MTSKEKMTIGRDELDLLFTAFHKYWQEIISLETNLSVIVDESQNDGENLMVNIRMAERLLHEMMTITAWQRMHLVVSGPADPTLLTPLKCSTCSIQFEKNTRRINAGQKLKGPSIYGRV